MERPCVCQVPKSKILFGPFQKSLPTHALEITTWVFVMCYSLNQIFLPHLNDVKTYNFFFFFSYNFFYLSPSCYLCYCHIVHFYMYFKSQDFIINSFLNNQFSCIYLALLTFPGTLDSFQHSSGSGLPSGIIFLQPKECLLPSAPILPLVARVINNEFFQLSFV